MKKINKRLTIILLIIVLFSNIIQAQDSIWSSISKLNTEVKQLSKLKINGWIQMQYQHADTLGALNLDGGDFPLYTDNRFMLRRGRIKFTYENSPAQYVFQLNMTERFINIADLYIKYKFNFIKGVSLQSGMMNRPFGYDISYSSSDRESPERARYTQLLTPNERDLGAEFIFEPKRVNGFKLISGVFNGTGLTIPAVNISDIDSKKDIISRMVYYNSTPNKTLNYGLGVSNYYGFERIANNRLYQISKSSDNSIKYVCKDSSSKLINTYTNRIYYGIEGLLSLNTKIGKSTLRGEYVFGQQPGIYSNTYNGNKSPQGITAGDTYVRDFKGGYLFFIHRFLKLPLEIVYKYEWFDPNSLVSGSQLLKSNNFSGADIKFECNGFGANFFMSDNVKFMVYYNRVKNEMAGNIPFYNRDIKDDILTLRLQIKF